MKKIKLILFVSTLVFQLTAQEKQDKPNIVMIMVDDLGVDGISTYGGLIQTPNIDKLAEKSIKATHCYAQPNCTPTRVKLMTGMHTYRSYDMFAYLNPRYRTFGNMMQDAGYKTAIAGKWQLNGKKKYTTYKPEDNHINRAPDAGFDEYCLSDYMTERVGGDRFWDCLVIQNGQEVPNTKGEFTPNIYRDFLFDFIRKNKQGPFFVYYPMALVHAAYRPTPDSKNIEEAMTWKGEDYRNFSDMVKYTDKIVGQFVQLLKDEGVYHNTLLIFTTDNGTARNTYMKTKTGEVRGDKGHLTNAGTHVPLLIHWPNKIKESSVFDGLMDFSDFYPTFADIVGSKKDIKNSDGLSFLPLIEKGKKGFLGKKLLFMQHDPKRVGVPSLYKFDQSVRNRFVRNKAYKLYQDNKFYHITNDELETHPLDITKLDKGEKKVHEMLQKELDKYHKIAPWDADWDPAKQ